MLLRELTKQNTETKYHSSLTAAAQLRSEAVAGFSNTLTPSEAENHDTSLHKRSSEMIESSNTEREKRIK